MEIKEIENIVSNFNETAFDLLAHKRFKKEVLEKLISDTYGFNCKLSEVDEGGCVADYAFISGVSQDYGYIDIYFLRVPFDEKDIYITEVSASAD